MAGVVINAARRALKATERRTLIGTLRTAAATGAWARLRVLARDTTPNVDHFDEEWADLSELVLPIQ